MDKRPNEKRISDIRSWYRPERILEEQDVPPPISMMERAVQTGVYFLLLAAGVIWGVPLLLKLVKG